MRACVTNRENVCSPSCPSAEAGSAVKALLSATPRGRSCLSARPAPPARYKKRRLATDFSRRPVGASAQGGNRSARGSQVSYAALGAVQSMLFGNGKWEHTNFNSRLQPLQIGLGTSGTNSSILQLDYGYGTTSNNGNVLSQTITIGATIMSQSYGYDGLNRLSSASEGPAWSQTYDCDRYGNRAVRVGSYIPAPALTRNHHRRLTSRRSIRATTESRLQDSATTAPEI